MINDLISRSALTRVITIECNPYGAPTIDFESGKRVLKLIENAPAVEEISVIEFKEPLPPVKAQKIVKALSKVPRGDFNIDELCRLRSDLRTGMVVGPSLKYQDRIDRYIKALDDVIAANMPEGCE